MNIADLCLARWTLPNGKKSPLLVPSYSSKGFSNIGEIFTSTAPYNSRVFLVSAYDLYYRLLPLGAISLADQVFIDSGGYESQSGGSFEIFGGCKSGHWSRGRFNSVLKSIEILNDLIVVSYDCEGEDLDRQIGRALKFKERYHSMKSSFLVKPDQSGGYLDIDKILDKAKMLMEFDCIGFTERELGETMLAKCRAVMAIRKRMNDLGARTPIHIFGCFDIPSILLFFFCGADIFDGLTWLKYSFEGETLRYYGEVKTENECASMVESDYLKLMMAKNAEYIRLFQRRMLDYCLSHDMSRLHVKDCLRERLLGLSAKIGIEM
jgi:hypothetical protein